MNRSCLVFSLFAFSLGAQIPTNGLLGYYPFIGNAYDASGNLYNGTVLGATLTADRFGNPNCAYQFNGVSDYISLPTTPYIGLNVYSYSLWFKAASNSNNGRIICIGENGGLCQSLTHQTSGYVFASSFNVGSNPNLSYSQSSALALNQWQHVVVTRDGTAIKMYVNGSLISPTTPTATNGQPADYGSIQPQRALIGARSSLGATFFFDGAIDDIRIYNVVLSPSEVLSLYNEPPCYVSVPVSVLPGISFCSGNSATLSATINGSVSWYSSASATTAIGNGSLFATPVYTASLAPATYIYFVEANSCTIVPRTAIILTVNPLPELSLNASASVACAGESVSLTALGATNYSWMPNASTFSVVSSVVVILNANTTFTLVGTDANGCTNSVAYTQSVTACVGLSEILQSPAVRLYPSPFCDELHLEGFTLTGEYAIFIYDQQGKPVKHTATQGPGGQITISGLSTPGLYAIHIFRNGELVHKEKILKE